MEISVIIPVYNAERYLRRCLDSVLAQEFKEMEVICIDDGSTDNCPQILEEYANKDKRIRVIRKENSGLVSARKTGIQAASGKYTGYVDSDDWIEPEMYKELYRVAEQYQADLVCSGHIWEKNTKLYCYDGFAEGMYRGEELRNLKSKIFFYDRERIYGIRPHLVSKLFKTSILKKVQMTIPDEVSDCEDWLCMVAYILESSAVYVLKKAFYHYIYHGESMSHRENLHYLDNIGRVYRTFRSMYSHPNFSKNLQVQCELYITKMVLHGLNECMGFSVSDLMRVNPVWIERFPVNSKIVLYGAGRLGKIYYRQIMADNMGRLQLCGWVDRNFQQMERNPGRIEPPEYLRTADYDYVLLALMDRQPAEEAREQLISCFGVAPEKIVWLEQPEIFWEYAEAAGVLRKRSGI